MEYSTIVLAAGKGSRTKLSYNKVFYCLKDGQTVLRSSLSVFLSDGDCKEVILVCSENELEKMEAEYTYDKRIKLCVGGNTRQGSVYNGLMLVTYPYVMIHDGARPFVKKQQIDELKQALKQYHACLLMAPSVDTTKIVKDGIVQKTLERTQVYHAQTPQCFLTNLIIDCHQKACLDNFIGTDDAQLVECYSNEKIMVVLSSFENKKITLPQDVK